MLSMQALRDLHRCEINYSNSTDDVNIEAIRHFLCSWAIDTNIREKCTSEVATYVERMPTSSEYPTGRIDGPPANGRSLSRLLAGVLVTKRATLIAPTLSAALCNFANDLEERANISSKPFVKIDKGILLKKNTLQFWIQLW